METRKITRLRPSCGINFEPSPLIGRRLCVSSKREEATFFAWQLRSCYYAKEQSCDSLCIMRSRVISRTFNFSPLRCPPPPPSYLDSSIQLLIIITDGAKASLPHYFSFLLLSSSPGCSLFSISESRSSNGCCLQFECNDDSEGDDAECAKSVARERVIEGTDRERQKDRVGREGHRSSLTMSNDKELLSDYALRY